MSDEMMRGLQNMTPEERAEWYAQPWNSLAQSDYRPDPRDLQNAWPYRAALEPEAAGQARGKFSLRSAVVRWLLRVKSKCGRALIG